MAGPLHGVRVLDLTTVVLGPYCTQIMADMGADVIKVESPDGDSTRYIGAARRPGMSGIFINLNRGKRSLVVDLKTPEARAALLRVARSCDVFVHSMRMKAIEGLGLAYSTLAEVAPSIVYCSLTGYGQRGRYRDKPAYDDVIQAGCGLVFLQAEHAGQPQYVTTVVADKVTGLMALSGILLALFQRSRSGKGQALEVPMFETMASFVLAENICGQAFDPPIGPAIYGRLTARARKPYRTRDGHLSVIVYTDRQWDRFLRLANRPDLRDDPRLVSFAARTGHVDFAYGLIESIIATRTSAEWIEALEDADIPVMPVLSTDQLFTDPHLRESRLIDRFVTEADGEVRLPRTPIDLSHAPAAILTAAPELGQHSRQILLEAGCSAADVEALVVQATSRRIDLAQ
jgi:crotonobetainyl-CoA:carnitine CoA-transferase CaiB-like acyl-CoA transferase